MTLIAVLILFPTPLLHPGGPNDAAPGCHVGPCVVAPLIGDPRSVSFPSERAGIGECSDDGWGDDEGAGSLLDGPVLPRPRWEDRLPSRRCGSPVSSSYSIRSRHLRC